MPAISFQKVSKTYRGGQVRALDGVSFDIAQGEFFGLLGPNGAGK
ncbi:MAG: ABC transporter ATP-binding protein, partial [Paucibacter sp.]|nr:ABC transporter ATP-binding protein [Roseateles sp.]